jgi:arginyl-tRNA synthetase
VTALQAPPIRSQIEELVRDAVVRAQAAGLLPAVALPEITVERPAKVEQGDFATNFALRAKRAVGPRGPNPMEIAGLISAQIEPDMPAYLAGVETAAPGFLNFTLADDWLRQQVEAIVSAGPAYGSVRAGNGRGCRWSS